VISICFARSSWLYSRVTARAARLRLAQAQGKVGIRLWDSVSVILLRILYVYTCLYPLVKQPSTFAYIMVKRTAARLEESAIHVSLSVAASQSKLIVLEADVFHKEVTAVVPIVQSGVEHFRL
jgi:hypothetical protein